MARNFGSNDYNEIIPGIVSSVSSFAVCLTYVMFPELRCLRYIELVFYVAINDLVASIAISLGYSENGSAACWFQGIATNYNYVSAILWTTIITFQVWLVVCRQNVIKDLTYAHLICWGVPLVATLLPLTTNTYANPDDEADWCFIGNRNNSPHYGKVLWFVLSFYGWVWTAMLFNLVFVTGILYRFYQMQDVPERVKGTVRKLLLYPIIISCCWALTTFIDFYTQVNKGAWETGFYIADGVGTILAVSQGFFFAIIFFTLNPVVGKAWMGFFRSIGLLRPEQPDDQKERDDKSVSMVSVSIQGTNSSIGNRSCQTGNTENTNNTGHTSYTAYNQRDNRRSSTGFLRSSLTSMNSWYQFPKDGKDSVFVHEEMDYMPGEGELRLSERLSQLAFNLTGGASMFRNSDAVDAAHRQSNVELNQNVNPMMSVAVNDFASGTNSGAQSDRATPQSHFEDGFGFDEDTSRGDSLRSSSTHYTAGGGATYNPDDARTSRISVDL